MNKNGKIEIIIGIIVILVVVGGLTFSTISSHRKREMERERREAERRAVIAAEEKRKAEEIQEDTPEADDAETPNLPGPLDVTPVSGFTGTEDSPEKNRGEERTGTKVSDGTGEKKAGKGESPEGWELVFQDDFSEASSVQNWDFYDGTWTVEDGELVGKGEQAHIAVLKKKITGDVRIEFTVHIDSIFLNDVSCFLNAEFVAEKPVTTYNTGYLLQYGGYTNSRNVVSRAGYIVREVFAPPIKRKQVYHMIGERKEGIIRYLIDGKEIARMRDDSPLNDPKFCRIGLYAWGGDNYYNYVKIYIPKKQE